MANSSVVSLSVQYPPSTPPTPASSSKRAPTTATTTTSILQISSSANESKCAGGGDVLARSHHLNDGVRRSSTVIVHQQCSSRIPEAGAATTSQTTSDSLATSDKPVTTLASVIGNSGVEVSTPSSSSSSCLNCEPDCQILLDPASTIVPMASSQANLTSTSTQTHLALAEFFHQHPVLKSFLAGSLSGTCSTLLFQPFDLVKTRIQNANFAFSPATVGQTSASGVVTSQVPNRVFPILFNVVKNEQIIGLWRGTLPSLMRCVPGVGLHFCCLDTLQNHFCDGRKPTASEAFAFGSASRSLAGVLLIPVTVIKTRYESGVFVYKSLTDAVRHTYKNEGARGLTSGLWPTLARDVPFSGLYYMFYSQLKSAVSPLVIGDPTKPSHKPSIMTSSFVTFVCGINAGLMASVVTQPMDVVKTHMQLYPKQFPTTFQTVILILKNKGPHGLFAGLVPRMMRRTLVASLTWTVFEHMMKNLGLK